MFRQKGKMMNRELDRPMLFPRPSESYAQDDINYYVREAISFSGDYYKDKIGMIGLRTYFKTVDGRGVGKYETLSCIIISLGRLRERCRKGSNYKIEVKIEIVGRNFTIEYL